MITVEMDTVCELTSEIVERQWNKEHYPTPHTVKQANGDWRYIEEVQDEFILVMDLIDEILNPEEVECLHNFDDDDDLAICKTCGVIRRTATK